MSSPLRWQSDATVKPAFWLAYPLPYDGGFLIIALTLGVEFNVKRPPNLFGINNQLVELRFDDFA